MFIVPEDPSPFDLRPRQKYGDLFSEFSVAAEIVEEDWIYRMREPWPSKAKDTATHKSGLVVIFESSRPEGEESQITLAITLDETTELLTALLFNTEDGRWLAIGQIRIHHRFEAFLEGYSPSQLRGILRTIVNGFALHKRQHSKIGGVPYELLAVDIYLEDRSDLRAALIQG